MRKKGYLFALIALAVFAAASAVTMVLWNALVPAIFGWTAITFWQAAGLMILTRLLFGCHWGRGGHHHGRMHGFHHHHNLLHKKWMRLSPEEREAFMERRRQHMHDFYGRGFADKKADCKIDDACCKKDKHKKSDD